MRQVGELTDDPLANSMAFVNVADVLEEGTTFIFSTWVCVANGSSCFSNHLTDP